MKTIFKKCVPIFAFATIALLTLRPACAEDGEKTPETKIVANPKPPALQFNPHPDKQSMNPEQARKKVEACGKSLEEISKIMSRGMNTEMAKIKKTIDDYNKACEGITGPLGKKRLPATIEKTVSEKAE